MADSRFENTIPVNERLIFAVDLPSVAQAEGIIGQLGDSVSFYKLGLELAMDPGYFGLVDKLVGQGKKIFADLKLYDVPATVGRTVKRLSARGITYLTVHAANRDSLAAAADNKGDTLQILGVTVLTSIGQSELESMGYNQSVESLVLKRAQGALDVGCDGVICSGWEAATLREKLDHRLRVVTPGIRPSGSDAGDQKRVMTVERAFQNGANQIVMGRPIRDAENPREAALAIQKSIAALA